MIEDLRLRQHPVRVQHEVAQQLEFGRAELDLLRADGDLVGVLVHRELARADDGFLVVVHRAAEDRLQAGNDLVEAEGLGDVVVAADCQSGDLVLGVILRREEQDRCRIAGCPQPLGHPEAVHVGEHDVQDDQVGFFLEHRRNSGCAVSDRPHREAREAKACGEKVTNVRLVVNN